MTAPTDVTFSAGTKITSQWLNGVNDHVNNLEADPHPEYVHEVALTMSTGASLVGYGDQTVDEALDERLPEIGTYALLRAYTGPVTAFFVRGVANIFDGGFGVFRVDVADTTTADNGGTVLVDASGRRWKRDFSGAINIVWFGADKSGLIDSVPAIQAAINYASSISGSVLIPDGTFLLDLLTFVDPTGLYAQRGLNVFGLLFAKSNVTIFGNGKSSVLKVAAGQLTKSFTYTADSNSGTYQNHEMPGTKGFQVFAQHPTDASISNFTIRDFVIDMNGYNNKVYPINAFGNQSICQALYINQGSNIVSERVHYIDAPGAQVICLWTGTTDCRIENNKFTNCGLLDGTNTNLDDHSTIYSMGQNASIKGNRLTQDVQWTRKGGSPIEVHGSATVVGNYISKYLSMGVVAGYNLSGDFVIARNIGRSITALGYDLYTSGNSSYTLSARIAHNDVELTKVSLAADHPAYKYRSFIISLFTNSNSGANEIEVFGNEVKMIGATGWATDLEDTYNAVFNLRLLSTVRAKGNTFVGFRGPIATLQEQKANASVLIEGNTFISCGRKHTYEVDNAVFNYTNRGDVSYGNKLGTLASKNNTFMSCSYATYLSANCVAAGLLVCPVAIDVTNDNTDTWIAPLVTSADLGTGFSAANWQFRYTCTGFIDATQGLKVLPDNTKEYAKSCYGEIVIRSGAAGGEIPGRFIKMRAVTNWNYYAIKYGITDPIALEVSPFGAQVGDRLSVFTGLIGQPTDFYCTTAGTPGTWQKVGQVGSRTGTVNPNSVYTPHFVGEEYLDTSTPRWYKSTGLTNTSWVALN